MKILIFALLLFSSFSVFGQCTKTIKDLPDMRGLRLQMPLSQVEKLYVLTEKEQKNGELTAVIPFEDATYRLTFSINKLIDLDIQYRETMLTQTEIRKQLSDFLGISFTPTIPNVIWDAYCEDFRANLSLSTNKSYLSTGRLSLVYQPQRATFKP